MDITTLLIIIATIAIVAIIVWASIYAYNCGKQSGNVTTSIVLIVFGLVIGFTLIPGLCHLVGTSKSDKKNEKENLEKEKLKAELEYYKKQNETSKNA